MQFWLNIDLKTGFFKKFPQGQMHTMFSLYVLLTFSFAKEELQEEPTFISSRELLLKLIQNYVSVDLRGLQRPPLFLVTFCASFLCGMQSTFSF
jgi:hypothetical protein